MFLGRAKHEAGVARRACLAPSLYALAFSRLKNAKNNTRSADWQFLKFNQSVG